MEEVRVVCLVPGSLPTCCTVVFALRHFGEDVESNELLLERSTPAVSRRRGGVNKRKRHKACGLIGILLQGVSCMCRKIITLKRSRVYRSI